MTRAQLVGWAESTSGFVLAPQDARDRLRAGMSGIVGANEVDVTIATDVLVMDRA
jgi:hypothetical protein